MTNNKPELRCSFCLKSEHEVRYLLGGSGAAYICGACIGACSRIISKQRSG